MTYEHVNSFIKKKMPSSLFLFHSCICFVSDAATNSPLNVLLKKNNCCTRFMYLFYIDIFMYLFTLQSLFLWSWTSEIPLKYKTPASVSFLFHETQPAQVHLFSHTAAELGLDWWTNKTCGSLKSCWRNRHRLWPAAQASCYQGHLSWFRDL